MQQAILKPEDVDLERLAKDLKLPVARVKAYIGFAPTTAAEAEEYYLQLRGTPAAAEAFDLWKELCATSSDVGRLLKSAYVPGEVNLKKELMLKWLKLWKEEFAAAQTFDQFYALFQGWLGDSHYPYPEGETSAALHDDVVDKLVRLCKTAEQATTIGRVVWNDIKDDADFLAKWADLCQTPEQIVAAFDGCGKRIDAIAVKRFGVCEDAKSLRKVRNQLDSITLSRLEGPYVRKMAEFYRKSA